MRTIDADFAKEKMGNLDGYGVIGRCFDEIPTVQAVPIDVLDKIRTEIEEITINGQVDEHTSFIRTGEQVKQMALNIIDKYRGEES